MKRRVVMGLVLALAWPLGAAWAQEEEGVVQVRSMVLHRERMVFAQSAYGTVVAAPARVQSIAFPRAGRLERWRVVPGQRVTRGMALVDFVTDPSVTAAYEQARTTLELARRDDERMQRQFAQQLVTAGQRDAAKKARQDAESAWQAQERLDNGIERDTVRAPFDGVVLSENAAQGDRLSPGVTVMQLAQASLWQVQLNLPWEQAAAWHGTAPVTVEPLIGPAHVWHGTISAEPGQVNAAAQGVDLWVALAPADGQMPGLKVRASFPAQVRTLWAVPRAAVLHDDEGDYVFQVRGQHAHRVAVSAAENGDVTGIEGPLDPAAPVVVEGNYELSDGMAVREAHR